MEYTKYLGKRYSKLAQEEVAILKYESKDNKPYMTCSRCARSIKRTMYVVQSVETGIELFYLGSCCIKHFE